MSYSLQINEDTEVIGENDAIKVYKNGVCSSIIKQRYGEKRFQKINNEEFVIITKESFNEHFIEIFTLKYNEIIFFKKISCSSLYF